MNELLAIEFVAADYVPIIIAIIAYPAVALITAYFSKNKVASDATKTLTDISLSLVEPQKRQIADLHRQIAEMKADFEERFATVETELAAVEHENEALHTWAKLLFAQIVEAGQEPIPFTFVEKGGP